MNNYILDFGTTVHCIEDGCGNLAKVAIDPEKWQVDKLVVEEGLLLKRSRVFPIHAVSSATNEEIRLDLHESDLRDYPEYRETVVERMPEGETAEPLIVQGSPYGLATSSPAMPVIRELMIEGVPDHLVVVDKDTPLEAVDSTVGSVRGFLVVPQNGLITHLLIHKGTIFVDEFWLPASLVQRVSPKGFFINLKKEELENYIDYDEDHEVVWDRMPTDEPLESAPITNGTGASSNGGNGKAVLGDEAALASMISDNLWNDPRTTNAAIEVINERGMVTLQGTVASLEAKQTAEQIANEYPGVVSVTNELVVDPRQ